MQSLMRPASLWVLLVAVLPSCSDQAGESSIPFASSAETTTTVSSESPGVENRPNQSSRKIIYHATLTLRVEDFSQAEVGIKSAIEAGGGYLGQFREDRSQGKRRSGHWTVRLPVSAFESFLEAIAKLGIAEGRHLQSQDVTEEYVDLEARKKNKEALETRLLDLVSGRGEIKDVLALETELSRVREDIEKLEGRLRLIADRVAFTTVDIAVYEPLHFQAADVSFARRVANAFRMSIDNLRRFAELFVIAAIIVAPWILALALLGTPLLWLRKGRPKAAASQPVGGPLT